MLAVAMNQPQTTSSPSYARISKVAILSSRSNQVQFAACNVNIIVIRGWNARWLLVELPRYSARGWRFPFPTARLQPGNEVLVSKLPRGFQFDHHLEDRACRWSSSYDPMLCFSLVFRMPEDLMLLQAAMATTRTASGSCRSTNTATILTHGSLALKEMFRQLEVEVLPTYSDNRSVAASRPPWLYDSTSPSPCSFGYVGTTPMRPDHTRHLPNAHGRAAALPIRGTRRDYLRGSGAACRRGTNCGDDGIGPTNDPQVWATRARACTIEPETNWKIRRREHNRELEHSRGEVVRMTEGKCSKRITRLIGRNCWNRTFAAAGLVDVQYCTCHCTAAGVSGGGTEQRDRWQLTSAISADGIGDGQELGKKKARVGLVNCSLERRVSAVGGGTKQLVATNLGYLCR
ncbi:hypothetical protein L226DRAFT_525085 [Lentinus tigrinus ALCF2SS1-7]|uniref:uncharacterized protein n=1 Tax=Lentinus tigrinus ALCF2SS1-7 TaxID=1328758 RepID=UPI001165CC1B|nr:hypothetical protein L226DRAFT_525085 [Lentinus tigrinus ALCF2SS1-7]